LYCNLRLYLNRAKIEHMKILIIDDERSIRNSLKEILTDEGYDVDVAEDGTVALEMVDKDKYNVIFCDIKMPNMSGIEVLDKFNEEGIEAAVVMISGHGDIDTAVECIKKGAFDFIQKPLDLNRILITIKNATEKVSLVKETNILKKKVYGQQMVGDSEPIKHIRDIIEKVAPTDARVLITGANGTGKELVARSLFEQSTRSSMPYIEVNCAAIPSELIESELFGHEKGSFTSAIKQHKGKFEQADGGTLFLDEIGDMSLAAQAKVLRVLQEKKFSRVGSDKDIDVDVRVIAATNKNLREEITKGNFREDLYHRISVIVIHVPSLDERKGDIPELIKYFVDQVCAESGMPKKDFSPEAVQMLVEKGWTGNIRELRNVVERLLILGGSVISAQDVKDYVNL
jgi:two-component system nitrogen regulation response regulator NtrX